MATKKQTWQNRIVGEGVESPDSLLANPLNWRIHPQQQQAGLTGVLDSVGWVQRVIVNQRTGHLVDGHLRVMLAMRSEQPEIPVLYVDLDEAEEALILATLDPIAAMAATDKAKLDALFGQIQTDSQAVQELIASIADTAGLDYGKQPESDAPPQIDRAEELRQEWGVELGQLWRLPSRTAGQEHRLICGDCTDRAIVERVMGGDKADCTVTDPPYGVGVDYSQFDDTNENVKKLIAAVMPCIMDNLPAAITPGVPAMWDYPRPAWVGAWVHPASTSSCAWGFVGTNPILYYGKDPYLKIGKGRRDSSKVMASDRKGQDEHPVSKPLALWGWLVERMTPQSGNTILDPFVGSGTTIIAAENLSRQCRAVEISPGYVAVALQRYKDAFGITAELVTDYTGHTG